MHPFLAQFVASPAQVERPRPGEDGAEANSESPHSPPRSPRRQRSLSEDEVRHAVVPPHGHALALGDTVLFEADFSRCGRVHTVYNDGSVRLRLVPMPGASETAATSGTVRVEKAQLARARLVYGPSHAFAIAAHEWSAAVASADLDAVRRSIGGGASEAVCNSIVTVCSLGTFQHYPALSYAIDLRHKALFELLLGCEAIDVNAKGDEGWTALLYASMERDPFFLERLLAHPDVQVNVREPLCGGTGLMTAAMQGYVEHTAMLLGHKRADLSVGKMHAMAALEAADLNNQVAISALIRAKMQEDSMKTRVTRLTVVRDRVLDRPATAEGGAGPMARLASRVAGGDEAAIGADLGVGAIAFYDDLPRDLVPTIMQFAARHTSDDPKPHGMVKSPSALWKY